MSVATARTIALEGATGHLIDVQVDVSPGVVKTALVGRPDASINEARDRCRAAVTNSGFDWPATRRVTVLLSPADLPKRGSHFDLAIAVGVLAASGKVAPDGAGRHRVPRRAVARRPAALRAGRAADDDGRRGPRHPHASSCPSPRGRGGAGAGHGRRRRPLAGPGGGRCSAARCRRTPRRCPPLASGPLLSWRGDERLTDLDLADVLGMADARFALEVAAAGGHHLMLSGPKGAGKTTLAERLPGLLPDL